jgi:hypothetical protein
MISSECQIEKMASAFTILYSLVFPLCGMLLPVFCQVESSSQIGEDLLAIPSYHFTQNLD